MLNQSEPNVILTAHATKVNRPEPNWTETQTCLAGRNHALNRLQFWRWHSQACDIIAAYPRNVTSIAGRPSKAILERGTVLIVVYSGYGESLSLLSPPVFRW